MAETNEDPFAVDGAAEDAAIAAALTRSDADRVVARTDDGANPQGVTLERELSPELSANLIVQLAGALSATDPDAAAAIRLLAGAIAMDAQLLPHLAKDEAAGREERRKREERRRRDAAKALRELGRFVEQDNIAGPDNRYERGALVVVNLSLAARLPTDELRLAEARRSLPAGSARAIGDDSLLELLETLAPRSAKNERLDRHRRAAGLEPIGWLSDSERIKACTPLLQKLGLWPNARDRHNVPETLRKLLPAAWRARQEALGVSSESTLGIDGERVNEQKRRRRSCQPPVTAMSSEAGEIRSRHEAAQHKTPSPNPTPRSQLRAASRR